MPLSHTHLGFNHIDFRGGTASVSAVAQLGSRVVFAVARASRQSLAGKVAERVSIVAGQRGLGTSAVGVSLVGQGTEVTSIVCISCRRCYVNEALSFVNGSTYA